MTALYLLNYSLQSLHLKPMGLVGVAPTLTTSPIMAPSTTNASERRCTMNFCHVLEPNTCYAQVSRGYKSHILLIKLIRPMDMRGFLPRRRTYKYMHTLMPLVLVAVQATYPLIGLRICWIKFIVLSRPGPQALMSCINWVTTHMAGAAGFEPANATVKASRVKPLLHAPMSTDLLCFFI